MPIRNLAATVLVLLACSSCCLFQDAVTPSTPLDASAIAPTVRLVVQRHDGLVDASGMSQAEKESWKLDSHLLLATVEAALGEGH